MIFSHAKLHNSAAPIKICHAVNKISTLCKEHIFIELSRKMAAANLLIV